MKMKDQKSEVLWHEDEGVWWEIFTGVDIGVSRKSQNLDGERKLQFLDNMFNLGRTWNLKLRLVNGIASCFLMFVRGTHPCSYHS